MVSVYGIDDVSAKLMSGEASTVTQAKAQLEAAGFVEGPVTVVPGPAPVLGTPVFVTKPIPPLAPLSGPMTVEPAPQVLGPEPTPESVDKAIEEVQAAPAGAETTKVFQEKFVPSLRESGPGSYITPFGTFDVSETGDVLRVSSVSGPSPIPVIKIPTEVAREIRPEFTEVGRSIRGAAFTTVREIQTIEPSARVTGLTLGRALGGLVFAPRIQPLGVVGGVVTARQIPSPGTVDFSKLSEAERKSISDAVESLEGQVLPGFELGELRVDESGMISARQVAINPINLGTSIAVADATIKDLGLNTDQYSFYQDPDTKQFQIVGASGVTQSQADKISKSYTEVPLGLPDVAPAEAIGLWLYSKGYLEKTGEKKWDPQKEKMVNVFDLSKTGRDKITYSANPDTGFTTLLVKDTKKSTMDIGKEINVHIVDIINEESAVQAARENIQQQDLLLSQKGPLIRGPIVTDKGKAFYLAYVAPRFSSLKDPVGIGTIIAAERGALESIPWQVEFKEQFKTTKNPLGINVTFDIERARDPQANIAARINQVNIKAREEMVLRAQRTDLPGFIATSPGVQISGLLTGGALGGIALGAVSVPAGQALTTVATGTGFKAAVAGKALSVGAFLAKPAVGTALLGTSIAVTEAPKLATIYQGADPGVVLTDVAFDIAKIGALGAGIKTGFPIGRKIGGIMFPGTTQFMGRTTTGEVLIGPEVPLGRAEITAGPARGEVARGVARFPTVISPTGEVVAGQFVTPEAFVGGPTAGQQVFKAFFEIPDAPELGFAYRESLRPGERFVITGKTSRPKFVEPFEPRAGTKFRITYLTSEGVPYYSEQTGVRTIVKGGSIVTSRGTEARIERMVQTPSGELDLETVRFSTRLKMEFPDIKNQATFEAGKLDFSKLHFTKEVVGNTEITQFLDNRERLVVRMTRTLYPTPTEIKGAIGSRLITPDTSLEGVVVSGEFYTIPGVGTEKMVLTDPAFQNMFKKYPDLLQRLGEGSVVLTDTGKVSLGEGLLTQLDQVRLVGQGVIVTETGIERFVEREESITEISKRITESIRGTPGLPSDVSVTGPPPTDVFTISRAGVPFVEGFGGELVRAPSVGAAGAPEAVVSGVGMFTPSGVSLTTDVAARGASAVDLVNLGFQVGDASRYLNFPVTDDFGFLSSGLGVGVVTRPDVGMDVGLTPDIGTSLIPRLAPDVSIDVKPVTDVVTDVFTVPDVDVSVSTLPQIAVAPKVDVVPAIDLGLEVGLETQLGIVPQLLPQPTVIAPTAAIGLFPKPTGPTRGKRLREIPIGRRFPGRPKRGKAIIMPDLFTAAVSQAAFGKATKPKFERKEIELLKAKGLIRVPTAELKAAGVPSSAKVLKRLLG